MLVAEMRRSEYDDPDSVLENIFQGASDSAREITHAADVAGDIVGSIAAAVSDATENVGDSIADKVGDAIENVREVFGIEDDESEEEAVHDRASSQVSEGTEGLNVDGTTLSQPRHADATFAPKSWTRKSRSKVVPSEISSSSTA
jgi:hypothetical protein